MKDWMRRNKRILLLKVAIGAALVINHYYPSDASWVVNLIWLFAF